MLFWLCLWVHCAHICIVQSCPQSFVAGCLCVRPHSFMFRLLNNSQRTGKLPSLSSTRGWGLWPSPVEGSFVCAYVVSAPPQRLTLCCAVLCTGCSAAAAPLTCSELRRHHLCRCCCSVSLQAKPLACAIVVYD